MHFKKLYPILICVLWVACVSFGAAALHSTVVVNASPLTTTFTPVADAYVSELAPASNYGSLTVLRVDASPVLTSYLRFNVQGLVGNVTQATLRVYAQSSSSIGYSLRAVTNNTWSESSITYNTAPPIGAVIASASPFTVGTWISVDVTRFITGNGAWNLALCAQNSTAINFDSRWPVVSS